MKNLWMIGVIFFLACNSKEKNVTSKEETVINDIFLTVIDTTGYGYRTLGMPSPQQKFTAYASTDTFLIAFDSRLFPVNEWMRSMQVALADSVVSASVDTAYMGILTAVKGNAVTDSSTLQLENIRNTGQYKLTDQYDFKQKETGTGLVGVVRFSKVLFNNAGTLAIGVIEIKDAFKSARWEMLLLQKDKDRWKLVHKELLAQS